MTPVNWLTVKPFTKGSPIVRTNSPEKNPFHPLKKLAIGPNNEGVLLNVLRFVGIIDENGKKTDAAAKVFTLHDDAAFQKALSQLVKPGYSELFDLHGDKAWDLDTDSLITFFRQHDQTSAITGKRQAVTFEALSSLCGHGEMPEVRGSGKAKAKSPKPKAPVKKSSKREKPKVELGTSTGSSSDPQGSSGNNVGLTVRIEVNLPSDGDQETYDRIFRSIKENLLNG